MLATLSLGMNGIGETANSFRSAQLVTMCTSAAMEEPIEPSGAAGPIVRCDLPHSAESWVFSSTSGVFAKPSR
jgi:hypothetical protein